MAMTVVATVAKLREQGRGGIGHHRLHAVDVVADAALDLARARLGEEAQRHPLQVGVEGQPQVVHHPLADHVRQVRLPDTDAGREERQHDHQRALQVEQANVLRAEQVVDDQLQQDRVDDTDADADQDQRGDHHQPRAVRPEEAGDQAQRLRPAARPRGEVRLIAAAPGPPCLCRRIMSAGSRGRPAPAAGRPLRRPRAARSRIRASTSSGSSSWLAWQRSASMPRLEGGADVDPQVRLLDAAHQHLTHLPRLQPLVEQLRES